MIIYKITNTITNKSYIGQTKSSLAKRWTQHKCDAKKKTHLYFHKAIKKYGIDCWLFEILEYFDKSQPMELLNIRERYWIEYHNTFMDGYNLTTGGEGGQERSEETKKKIGLAHKGKVSPMKGKTHSEETKQKMRNKANNMSREHKKKISEAKLGHIVSEEAKQKISLNNARTGNKGYVFTDENKRKMSNSAKNRKKIK